MLSDLQEELFALSEAFSQASTMLSEDLLRFERAISETSKERQRELLRVGLEQTLGSIGDVFSHLMPAKIGHSKCVNLMIPEEVGLSKANIQSETKFHPGEHVRCPYLLVPFCRDKHAGAPEPLKLPVVDDEHRDATLPGAPLAFVTGKTQVVICGRIEFASGVTEELKKRVEEYYQQQKFSTAISLCVERQCQTERRIIGVVNVHSNLADLLSEDGLDDNLEEGDSRIASSVLNLVVEYVEDALAPFLVLVGMFAEKMDQGGADEPKG